MKTNFLTVSLIALFSLSSCDFSGIFGSDTSTTSNDSSISDEKISEYNSNSEVESSITTSEESSIFVDESNSYSEESLSINSEESVESSSNSIEESISEKEVLTPINDEAFRLSNFSDCTTDSNTSIYKLYAPYTDTYTLKILKILEYSVYDSNMDEIAHSSKSARVFLNESEIFYLKITTSSPNTWFSMTYTTDSGNVELPYKINSQVDTSKLSTASSTTNPLKASNLSYTKRSDDRGLYVNCNNPEALSTSDINKCLTRQDVTNKDVFFTFEHNNAPTNYYYGYRVTNTGNEDLFVTVKNLGYQPNGAGCWLGEDEWIKFYNTKFNVDTSNLSSSQLSNYDAYVGFCNTYTATSKKPITYRIPQGKYIYVIGGTTLDAYNNINVFNSANIVVNKSTSGCSNAAVLFETHGSSADGAFLIYDDKDASKINKSDYVIGNKQQGYVGTTALGSQYVGYDNCHGVVDADYQWTFNDKSPSGYLKTTYKNPYFTNQASGTAYGLISSILGAQNTNVEKWYTHINGNNNYSAVGTDMTDYITVDSNGKKIVIDQKHFDGNGNLSNIGNWMVDYIDTITLVNQGDKERKVTYSLTHSGVILAFVRNMNGLINYDYNPSYLIKVNSSSYGDAIEQYFTYTVTIPAHSIVQYAVDYNLLANSYGCIGHAAYLD